MTPDTIPCPAPDDWAREILEAAIGGEIPEEPEDLEELEGPISRLLDSKERSNEH